MNSKYLVFIRKSALLRSGLVSQGLSFISAIKSVIFIHVWVFIMNWSEKSGEHFSSPRVLNSSKNSQVAKTVETMRGKPVLFP